MHELDVKLKPYLRLSALLPHLSMTKLDLVFLLDTVNC